MKKFFSNPLNVVISISLAVLTFIVVYLGITVYNNYYKKDIIIPDFSKMNQVEAEIWINDNKLKEDEYLIEFSYDDEINEGELIYQSIEAGNVFNGYLKLIYSKGEDPNSSKIVVPNFNSMNVEEIEKWGKDNDVTIKIDYEYSNDIEKGKLIKQNIDENTKVNKGTIIQIVISDGKETNDEIYVGDSYLGIKETDFINVISNLGLKAIKQSQTYKTNKYQTGTIYAYDSSSDGISFKKGDNVKYWLVDNGDTSEEINVPDTYLGYKENDFINAIKALGLNPIKQSKTYTSTKYLTGTIYAYDSSSDGISFKKGDNVKYWLVDNGDTNNEINVPDTYLGYKENDFINAIKALGLNPIKQSKTYTSTKYETGTIYAYDSSSDGISFKKGDNVKYWLVDNGDTSEEINVPDSYIGYTETNFINTIKSLGLNPIKQSKTYTSTKYETGTIYAYDSSSDGISFKKGDNVKYWLVDNGDTSEEINVPDSYIGYTETNFINTIKSLGLNPIKQSKTYTSTKYETGTIYAYDSSSDGISFKKGDNVKYYLVDNGSTIVETITLENLVGKDLNYCQTYLNNNGLKMTKIEEYSDNYASGIIIKMNPSANSKVNKGSTVTLTVSKGKEPVQTAPLLDANFIINGYAADTFEDTKNKLIDYFNEQGFTNVSYVGVESTKSVGAIVSVSVNGNSSYAKGDYPINSTIIVQIVNKRLN